MDKKKNRKKSAAMFIGIISRDQCVVDLSFRSFMLVWNFEILCNEHVLYLKLNWRTQVPKGSQEAWGRRGKRGVVLQHTSWVACSFGWTKIENCQSSKFNMCLAILEINLSFFLSLECKVGKCQAGFALQGTLCPTGSPVWTQDLTLCLHISDILWQSPLSWPRTAQEG